MLRTLEMCKVSHKYGKPEQKDGICQGVMLRGKLHEKCQVCYLHDIQNIAKVCAICGKPFYSTQVNATVCSEKCRSIKRGMLKKSKARPAKKKTIDDIMKEVDEYNLAHGTHLTYGKYKAMKYIEQLREERGNV